MVIFVPCNKRVRCGWADIYLRGDGRLTDHAWEHQSHLSGPQHQLMKRPICLLTSPADSEGMYTNFPLKVNWFECYKVISDYINLCCFINNFWLNYRIIIIQKIKVCLQESQEKITLLSGVSQWETDAIHSCWIMQMMQDTRLKIPLSAPWFKDRLLIVLTIKFKSQVKSLLMQMMLTLADPYLQAVKSIWVPHFDRHEIRQ